MNQSYASHVKEANRQFETLLDYYRLAEPPFSISPDPRFLYHTAGHLRAFSKTRSNIIQRQGLTVICGDVGTGKSTVGRRIELEFGGDEVANQYETRLVKNAATWTTSSKMIRALSSEFGCDMRRSEDAQWAEFERYAIRRSLEDRVTLVLIIDEAQGIPPRVLIRLREILNFEADTGKFVQILLLGTLELWQTLSLPAFRPLRSRVAGGVSFLAPLDNAELRKAILFRLAVAGRDEPLFDDACYDVIYEASSGVLRTAVDICRTALEYSFQAQEPMVSEVTALEAADEVQNAIALELGVGPEDADGAP
jgi:general secretion pathway protein A